MSNNTYAFPIEPAHCAKITADASPAHQGRLKHAIDFIVPEGTPVRAAADGVIVDVKQDSDIGGDEERFDAFGNYIEVEHAHGEYSIYEHLKKDRALVRVGERVKKGQVIGTSGATGWLGGLGPHLHFDVHRYIGDGPEDYETLPIHWKIPPLPSAAQKKKYRKFCGIYDNLYRIFYLDNSEKKPYK